MCAAGSGLHIARGRRTGTLLWLLFHIGRISSLHLTWVFLYCTASMGFEERKTTRLSFQPTAARSERGTILPGQLPGGIKIVPRFESLRSRAASPCPDR